MKTSKLFAAALVALFAVPALAQANHLDLSKVYVAGQIGYSNPTDSELEDNAAYAIAVGYKLSPVVRAELEGSYRKHDLEDGVAGEVRTTLWSANVWYDFVNDSKFTPYVGGGLGLAYGKGNLTAPVGFKEHDTAFAYQLGGGVAYELCEHIDLTADYRFIDTNKFSDIGDDYKSHEFRAGIRYNF